MGKHKDQRLNDREKRRLMVRFGVDRPDKTAFTKNLSPTGMFLQTNSVVAPGKMLQIEIAFPDAPFTLWARVVWAKKVPPQLAHVVACGMGVCFVDAGAEWDRRFERWRAELRGGKRP